MSCHQKFLLLSSFPTLKLNILILFPITTLFIIIIYLFITALNYDILLPLFTLHTIILFVELIKGL